MAALGCVVIDAPEDLDALAVFGLQHFAEEDDRYGTAFLDGLSTPVVDNDSITILPAVAGG